MKLQVKDITINIGKTEILHGVTAKSDKKQFVGVVGPNGSGKSTMLKAIYRALQPSGGTVLIDDIPLSQIPLRESARKLGVMTQMSELNFDFRVDEVVLMGRTPHKKMLEQDTQDDYDLVKAALMQVGMADMESRRFNTLSGGEKQRVLMARALTQQPQALILDEPTNHLDIQYQIQLLNLVKSLEIEVFAAIHDLNLALTYCDYIYVMNHGRVAAQGTPDQVLTPELIKEVFGVCAIILKVPNFERNTIAYV